MKIEFVELSGFRGVRDRLRLDFCDGFVVLTGRNGAGKSTILDAIDFAMTGTINRFAVTDAKGGGLDEHIWWMGSGTAEAHYVSVGFVQPSGTRFSIVRDRDNGSNMELGDIIGRLCQMGTAPPPGIETLVQTSMIRRELIAALSLDLPEQARFLAIRSAIGAISGPDYSSRTGAVLSAANVLSSAIDRVNTLDARVSVLKEQSDKAAARLSEVEKAVESARQIDASGKTVANQMLSEQFDTVMPLLKELYRRLRPHPDWLDIEADFGGKVRASLNFVVGDRGNPQFLFSSGQRRAAGLAFLLAIHLSRTWCLWNSLLFDDPVQHIDDYRALNLAEVLSSIRRTGRQVIVAVEDVALAEVLCRRLRSATGDSGRRIDLRISTSGTTEIANLLDIAPLPSHALQEAKAS